MRRRSGRISVSASRVMSRPSKTMRPAVTSTSRSSARPSVVLPEPLSPTMPTVSPRAMRSVTPCRTLTPGARRRTAAPPPKATSTCLGDEQVVAHGAATSARRRAIKLRRIGRRPGSGSVVARAGLQQRVRVGVARAPRARRRPRPASMIWPPNSNVTRVADLRDDAEIVGDEQHRRAVRGLHVADQAQDLFLHRHVERRRRLVGDDELRLQREGGGDQHALPHAAGELVRESCAARARARGYAPRPSKLQRDARARSARRAPRHKPEAVGQLRLDPPARD